MMTTPIAVQRLFLELRGNFANVKINIVQVKTVFCNSFEIELNLPRGQSYAEDVFDYIYNVFDNQRAFESKELFAAFTREIRNWDYKYVVEVTDLIKQGYQSLLTIGIEYFSRSLGIKHPDANYAHRVMERDKKQLRERLLKMSGH